MKNLSMSLRRGIVFSWFLRMENSEYQPGYGDRDQAQDGGRQAAFLEGELKGRGKRTGGRLLGGFSAP